ncbi:MucR family transcriptional regulator [Falsigemmobacter intermedius]|uniref:MucR family transcriptional regulator n=1 Tax=Falsigemmobacter intermedius TaxID=1553448 RepID=A0A444MDY9_9RHOB|nr:MucR family transcriptional regulator [Falsigemmobacter intermedius]RWY43056.1 MucR family transcriptional regulator [Falsigemmobacter intermedius]
MDTPDKTALVAQIVSAFASRPDATVEAIVALTTRLTLELADAPPDAPPPAALHAAVASGLTPESALRRDKIFCLCCGKGFQMLKRHLGAEHGMTESEYRQKFGLADDYPLVAPGYSERKANYARSVGFGKYSRQPSDAE